MFYINEIANESGNHGNPVSNPREGMVALPDEFMTAYLNAMGFVFITTDNGVVNSVTVNQAAYDAYMAGHQEAAHTADRDYEPGEYLTLDGTLYRVRLPIFGGTQITPGTNVTETTIEAELANREEV